MWTESKGRRQKVECRSGEDLESGILGNGLGCRALRQLRRNREIRRILENEGEVTARREPRPTGRARLPLRPVQSPVGVSVGQCSRQENFGGLAARIFHCQFKFLTVRNLTMAWAVTACDFRDALWERRTGGIDRCVTKSKRRFDSRQWRQRRACPAIRVWMAQATGRCRRVPVPRGSADIPVCGCWGLSSPQFAIAKTIAELESSANPQAGKPALPVAASLLRSAGRRPARASRPCYPFSGRHSRH